MIIKKLNLLSFGKFKNKSLLFSDSLNIIYGSNESGKSTISAFIEAMLYSYPPHDKSRLKYFPWDGSLPSGSMTFSHLNREYTVFRSFGQTPKGDSIKTEPEISLSEILPDRETFRKSLYTAENKASDFGKTSGMDARISNIMSTGDENINARDAIARLTEQRKRYVKPRSSTGELQKVISRISELENELSVAKKDEAYKLLLSKEISDTEKSISDLETQISVLENYVNSYSQSIPELDLNLLHQKEYLATITTENNSSAKQKRFNPLIIYTLFAIAIFIIAFFLFEPLLPLSLIPFILYYCVSRLHKRPVDTSVDLSLYTEALNDLESLNAKKSEILSKISSSTQKISSLQKSLLSKREKLHEAKNKLTATTSRPCDVILSELEYTRSLRDNLTLKVRALDAAIEAIGYAAERFNEDFTPKVSEKAMEYISEIAPKNSREVSLSLNQADTKNPLSISVKDPLPHNLELFSFGFRQEVYLAFRIALSEFLFGDDFPIIIDDPFLGSDSTREKAICNLLVKISKTRQIIVFTNRKNDYFKQLNCNFIDIG